MTDRQEGEVWKDAGPAPSLQIGQIHGVNVGEQDFVVVGAKTGLKVFQGRCPHQGALLAEGEVQEGQLICRSHGWKFNCENGDRVGGSSVCLKTFAHKIEESRLWVALAPKVHSKQERLVLRTFSDLPGPKGEFLLGNARQLDTDRLHNILEAWGTEYGQVYAIRIGGRRIIVISDPKLIATALRERPDHYRRGKKLEPLFKEMGIDGVFSAEGEAWRPQRKLAVRALSHRNLKGFYPVLQKMAARLHRRWAKEADTGRTVDIQADLMRFTVDVTTLLAFGHDVDTLSKDDDALQQYLEPVFPILATRLQAIIPYWRFLRLPKDREVDKSLAALRKWLSPIIEETRARLDANPELGEHPTNFLESMLSSKDEHDAPFSEERIFGNAMTMLLAGEDTTANTLAWAVHHLLDDPASTTQLEQELDEQLADSLCPATAELAGSLRFASAVASETMRVRPVAPLLFSDCNGSHVLGDLQVDETTTLALLLRAPVLDETIIEQAAQFRPQRWLDPTTEETTQHKQVFMPFGSGPRICPGRSLALLEMNVVLATLYKHFDVQRVGASDEVQEKFSFTMVPTGLKVKLKARKKRE